MKKISIFTVCAIIATTNIANACTGITLRALDKSVVVARTVDWSGSEMNNIYVIVPRGHVEQSLLPDGSQDGIRFTAKYGFVGLGMERPEFIVDGTNEVGLSAELFYFPRFGKYRPYSASTRNISLADFQVVSWILSQFSTIDEVKEAIDGVRIINIDPTASTVHWRITEPNGRQIVMEIIDGVATFHENPNGVITNAPGLPWHLTNLSNYINLRPGTIEPTKFGPLKLQSISNGTGLLGLPGDFSSPSRFVRATLLRDFAIPQATGTETIKQACHILNNMDVPFGATQQDRTPKFDMPAATQWTIATDITNRQIYYHTMYNRTLRHIDISGINFETVPYQFYPLDMIRDETVLDAPIKR